MVEWKEYRIKDICEIIDGDRGKNYPQDSDFYDDEFCLFLNAGNVTKNGWDFNNVHFITKEKDTLLRKGKASINDIIMTTRGTVGNFTLFDNQVPYSNIRINSGMVIIRTIETIDKYFLLYLFKSDYVQNIIKLFCSGSAQPQLPIKDFNKIKLHFPPLPTQQKIASILSAYDNLIQNYKKQIDALQTAASELYKEWFVRFPGWQNTEFENGIPKGWKIEKLFDVAKIIYGYPFNSDEFCDDNSLNPVVRIRDILDNHTDTYTSESCDEKYWINPNEMLIGMDGIFHMSLWTGERALQNQRTVRVTSKIKNLSNYYLYFSLYPQIKALEQMIVGTTVAHLGDKHLKKITILIPEEKILKMSYERLEPMMNRIYSLQQQITNLTQQRDLLLPRLMSGKLEVK